MDLSILNTDDIDGVDPFELPIGAWIRSWANYSLENYALRGNLSAIKEYPELFELRSLQLAAKSYRTLFAATVEGFANSPLYRTNLEEIEDDAMISDYIETLFSTLKDHTKLVGNFMNPKYVSEDFPVENQKLITKDKDNSIILRQVCIYKGKEKKTYTSRPQRHFALISQLYFDNSDLPSIKNELFQGLPQISERFNNSCC